MAGDSSDLGVAGKVVCAGKRAQPGTLKSVQRMSHKKGGLAVTLERKIFCGTRWELEPDFLWVEKPVGGEEVEVATTVDSALKKCDCWGGETPGRSYTV